jgi:tellurite resistance protein
MQLRATLGDPAIIAKLRDAAKHLGVASIKDGSWFQSVIRAHLKAHVARIDRDRWDRLYPGVDLDERARREVQRVALKSAAAGAIASTAASTGELLSLITEGLAAPVGLPAAALAMALEAAYTSLLQIDLACDLGLIYGVPFNAADLGEVATLFGMALDLDVYSSQKKEEEDTAGAPHGLLARLIHFEEGEIGARIGRKLLEDSLVRNVLPVVGVPISARWNYVATIRFGNRVKRYVRGRRALIASIERLRIAGLDAKLLLHGAWLLSIADGEAGHEEMLALAAISDLLSDAERSALDSNGVLSDNEEGWLAAVAALAKQAGKGVQSALLDALSLVAAADHELSVPERRFLERVWSALGSETNLGRVEEIRKHLENGWPMPQAAS